MEALRRLVMALHGRARVTNGAIITDCNDSSARGRYLTRWRTLLGFWEPTFIGIEVETGELEAGSAQAAIHLLNQIDAARSPEIIRWWHLLQRRGTTVFLVNSASRGSTAVKRENGSPFCYFWADARTLVVSTLDGPVLKLANYYGIIPEGLVQELDIPTVMDTAVRRGWISLARAEHITNTQFRSFEFEPLAAKWLVEGREIPAKRTKIDSLPREGASALYIDSFGNITLDITPKDFGYQEGKLVTLANGQKATCIPRLADVPDGETAITIGSDGLGELGAGGLRLMELVIQKGRAADVHGIKVGDEVVHETAAPAFLLDLTV